MVVKLPSDETITQNKESVYYRLLEQDALINFFRLLALSPVMGESFIRTISDVWKKTDISPYDRELIILTVGTAYDSEYEVGQHKPIALSVGISEQQVEAICSQNYDSEVFSPREKLLLEAVRRIIGDNRFSVYSEEKYHTLLTDKQWTEVITLIGSYYTVAKLTTVLELPLDLRMDSSMSGVMEKTL